MIHEESRLQQQCVAWFRAQYQPYAMLLTHPANEGNGNRVSGAIHKGEGTVPGTPDLLLFLPSYHDGAFFGCLGIEMKTAKGKQSQSQKDFERLFRAAGNDYTIVRSFEEFKNTVNAWMRNVSVNALASVEHTNHVIQLEQHQREVDKFKKMIRKK